MNTLTAIVEITGWTLLHFLWQGAAIAAGLWVFLRLVPRNAATARYGAAGMALLLMLGAVGGTAAWLAGREDKAYKSNEPPYTAYTPADSPAPGALPPRAETALPLPPVAAALPRESTALPAAEPAPPEASPAPASASPALPAALPWGVAAWAAGVAFFSLRLLLSWRTARRWRRSGSAEIPEEWRARFAALCETMRVSRPVRLLSSATLRVPVVAGWLRPVVLIPASLLTGLPTGQLTAILAHELAHIRRHDCLVNLLQCLAETLLFYHPAVWWVSSVMRREREHCCDDTATAVCGGTLDYARALTALEEFRALPAAGLSAAGGPLLQRIRRLAGLPEERASGLSWVCGLLSLTAVGAVLALTLLKPAWAEEKSPAAANSKSPPNNEAAQTLSAEQPSGEPEAGNRRAFDTVQTWLAASTADMRMKHHDLTGNAQAMLEAYYQHHPARPFPGAKLMECMETDKGRWKLMVEIAEIPGPQFFEVFEKDGKLLVEWESASLYQRDRYADLQKDRPKTAVPFMAVCVPDDYYNGPFADAEKFQCYRLTYPGVDATLYGYAVRDSETAKVINLLQKRSLRLEVKFPELPLHSNQIEIVKVAESSVRTALLEMKRFQEELELSVPAAEPLARPRGELVVNVAPDGSIVMNSITLTLDELQTRLAEVAKVDNKRAIIIRGDKSTQFELIVKVLGVVHKAGLLNVSFATRELEPKPHAPSNGDEQNGKKEPPAPPEGDKALPPLEVERVDGPPLPQPTPSAEELARQITVTVTKDGTLCLSGAKATDEEAKTQLAGMAKEDNTRNVLVRADKSTPAKRVAEVIGIVSNAGFKDVAFATANRPDSEKIVVDPKLPGDFTFTAKSHYPAHIVERPDGTLESSLGDLTPEDRIKLPQTASVMTDSQGEHEIKYCDATLKEGTLLLDFNDCGPSYHGSLSVSVAADQTFTCRWDFNPIAGPKLTTRVVSQKLTLDHWPAANGKRLRGSIDVVLADKLPSGDEKQFYVRGLFDTPVGDQQAKEGRTKPGPKASGIPAPTDMDE